MLGPLSPSAIKRALSPAPRGGGDAAEQQRRLTEHLRRNLGLASLRVTISTEQRTVVVQRRPQTRSLVVGQRALANKSFVTAEHTSGIY